MLLPLIPVTSHGASMFCENKILKVKYVGFNPETVKLYHTTSPKHQ